MLEPIKPNYEIEVALDKDSYIVGETINGNAVLKLKKPIEGRGVFASLKKIEVYELHSRRGLTPKPSEEVVYEEKKMLAPAATYSDGRKYSFAFTVPVETKLGLPASVFFWIKKIVLYGVIMKPVQTKWRIVVKIDVPNYFDIFENKDVSIRA